MAAACAVAAPALRSACQDALPPPPAYREVQPALGAIRQQLLRGVGVLRERRAQQQVARAAGKHRHAAAAVRRSKLRAGGSCKERAGRGGALGGAGRGGACGRAAPGRQRRVGLPWPGGAFKHGVVNHYGPHRLPAEVGMLYWDAACQPPTPSRLQRAHLQRPRRRERQRQLHPARTVLSRHHTLLCALHQHHLQGAGRRAGAREW